MPLSFPLAGIVRRLTKGSALTYAEEDNNKTVLEEAIETAYDEAVKTADLVALTDLPSAPTGTDEIMVIRAGVPYKESLSVVKTYLTSTAPAAFVAGNWTATAGVGQIEVNITALPSDGGSAITSLQYRLDGGTPVTFGGGAGTGIRTITGLTGGVEYDVEIRAVNENGAGAWSDIKARTPTAGGGSLAIVQAPDLTEVVFAAQYQQALAAVGSGNAVAVLVVSPTSAGAPDMSDSAGGGAAEWGSPVHTYDGGFGQTARWYARANITSGLTWVRATFTGGSGGYIAAVELSGAGSSLVANATGGTAQGSTTAYTFPFTSTVANTLFMGAIALSFGRPGPTGVAPVTAGSTAGGELIYGRGIFPTAGSNTAQIDISAGTTGDKSWCVFRPGP